MSMWSFEFCLPKLKDLNLQYLKLIKQHQNLKLIADCDCYESLSMKSETSKKITELKLTKTTVFLLSVQTFVMLHSPRFCGHSRPIQKIINFNHIPYQPHNFFSPEDENPTKNNNFLELKMFVFHTNYLLRSKNHVFIYVYYKWRIRSYILGLESLNIIMQRFSSVLKYLIQFFVTK